MAEENTTVTRAASAAGKTASTAKKTTTAGKTASTAKKTSTAGRKTASTAKKTAAAKKTSTTARKKTASTSIRLSADEKKLIGYFRDCGDIGKMVILTLAEKTAEKAKAGKEEASGGAASGFSLDSIMGLLGK